MSRRPTFRHLTVEESNQRLVRSEAADVGRIDLKNFGALKNQTCHIQILRR
jgi:hypothetical protein